MTKNFELLTPVEGDRTLFRSTEKKIQPVVSKCALPCLGYVAQGGSPNPLGASSHCRGRVLRHALSRFTGSSAVMARVEVRTSSTRHRRTGHQSGLCGGCDTAFACVAHLPRCNQSRWTCRCVASSRPDPPRLPTGHYHMLTALTARVY
jgi:hypothetical protein